MQTASEAHPRHRLDVAFQTPMRFSLMAALGRRTEVDFSTLKAFLEADDSSLSKAISTLEKVGYVKTTKGFVGKRPRTWVEPTTSGIKAFDRHCAALQAIALG